MASQEKEDRSLYLPLLAATFVIATAGLVYELIAGTVSSYLLGDSVYQFSLVIGLFMTAMGLGAWLSRHVEALEQGFVSAQIALGLIGGFSAPILFFAFVMIDNYEAFLLLICLVVGTLVGLEIPLIVRLLQREQALRVNISNILTADYLGALAAALLFPLVLVPQLGLMAVSLLFGLFNILVAGLSWWIFRARLARSVPWIIAAALILVGTGFTGAERLTSFLETRLFEGEIIWAETTPYQRLAVVDRNGATQLFINGNLQFDSRDEHRYHEALVHPAMTHAPRQEHVLILGGGDGLAAREVLRYPDVETITLVDLDPAITSLFHDNPKLRQLNQGALGNPKVTIVNDDAWKFLDQSDEQFDVVIIDLPDPHSFAVSKLYSLGFYSDLAQHMKADSVIVTQATSPLFAPEAFWSIHNTLAATEDPFSLKQTLDTLPYHAYVPSFGDWGFVMAGSRLAREPQRDLPDGLRFLTADAFDAMTRFPPDMAALPSEVNTILDHPLPAYYEKGWSQWFR